MQRGACREPLRVRSFRACRRGSVIASDRRNCRWDDLTAEGRTGLPILVFRPPTRPGTAGRSLGSRCRTDATNTCQNFQRRQEWFCSTSVPSTGVTKPHRANAHQWGLRDTRAGVILAHAAVNLPFAILLLKSFFDDIPREVGEAASIDLEQAARTKIALNAEKYPVEKARGSSQKYDAL